MKKNQKTKIPLGASRVIIEASARGKEETEGDPICEKCGNVVIEENGEFLCPRCQGKIDFLGGEDEELV